MRHWFYKDRRWTCPHICFASVSGAWMPRISDQLAWDRMFDARSDIFFRAVLRGLPKR